LLTWETLEDAGQVPEALAGTDVGVFLGISTGDYARLLDRRGERRDDGHAVTGNAASLGANRISYVFDWRGPSVALDTACSSSLVAVHLACRALRDGEAAMALAGGVNLVLDPEVSASLHRAGNGQGRIFRPAGAEHHFELRVILLEKAGKILFKPGLQPAERLQQRDRREIPGGGKRLAPAKANRRHNDQDQITGATQQSRQCKKK
jgi:hypothetical protein